MHKIICPYCFGEFQDDQVLFRANTGFTRKELEKSQYGDGESDGEKQLFLRYNSQDHKDTELITYWESRGGSGGYVSADPKWDMPHIDPRSPDFRRMLSDVRRPGVGEDGFVRDGSGFVTRVYDRYSDWIQPMTRLCPHCHNPLPLADYGKYPTYFISVVGITTCGKTVYLHQLLDNIASAMGHTGYTVGVNNLATLDEYVAQGKPLPGSTDNTVMRRPLAINMLRDNDAEQGFTLVFYDIAGENCVESKDGNVTDAAVLDSRRGIGNFIARADGLMFLIDPKQIPGFAPGTPDMHSVQEVISVVQRIRVSLNQDEPHWNNVPVAVVLTKTDEITYLNPDSLMFQFTGSNGGEGFGRQEFFTISRELQSHFERNAQPVMANLASFGKKAFCGVSAITCGVEHRFELFRNQYILDEHNDRRFTDVQKWIRGWNERTPEERRHYHPCPVQQIKNYNADNRQPIPDAVTGQVQTEPIVFAPEESVTSKNAGKILTEIYADSEFGSRIYLNLWEIFSQINRVSYPMAAPNPRRFEEPLKWILWRLGLIGPYYIAQPRPEPRFLESSKRYQERVIAWEQEYTAQRNRFYEGVDLA